MPKSVGKYANVEIFYHKAADNYWMSNTCVEDDGHQLEIKENNVTYPTSEHYFHAMKFQGDSVPEMSYRLKVLAYKGSFKDFPAFARSESAKLKLEFDAKKWDGEEGMMNGEAHRVMRRAVELKLEQHQHLKNKLLAFPEDTVIVEALSVLKGKRDVIWSDGGDGCGMNCLGKIYMEKLQQFKKGLSQDEAIAHVMMSYRDFAEHRQAHYSGKTLYESEFDSAATLCAESAIPAK